MKKTTRLAVVLAGGIAANSGLSAAAVACSDSPYIGAVCFIASQYCPYDYIEADGTILPINRYQALFSLVGITFGGNGSTTFGVPNLRGRSPVGWGAVRGTTSIGYGQSVGQESVMLAPAQMAPHDHPAVFSGTGGGGGGGITTVTVPEKPGNLAVTAKLPLVAAAAGTVTATPAPVAGNSNYLGAVTATAANGPANYTVNFTGLYSATDPGTAATAPVTTSVTGNSTIPEFSFVVPTGGGITGGTVTVGVNIQPSQQIATPVRDPAIGLTACIATQGTYPTRP